MDSEVELGSPVLQEDSLLSKATTEDPPKEKGILNRIKILQPSRKTEIHNYHFHNKTRLKEK